MQAPHYQDPVYTKPPSIGLHGASDEEDEVAVPPHSLRNGPAVPRRRRVEPHATAPDAMSIIAHQMDTFENIRTDRQSLQGRQPEEHW